MILYLHGFRSSPASYKARLVTARMGELNRADQLATLDLEGDVVEGAATA